MNNHTGPVEKGITYDIRIEEDKYTVNKPKRVILRASQSLILRARIYEERRKDG